MLPPNPTIHLQDFTDEFQLDISGAMFASTAAGTSAEATAATLCPRIAARRRAAPQKKRRRRGDDGAGAGAQGGGVSATGGTGKGGVSSSDVASSGVEDTDATAKGALGAALQPGVVDDGAMGRTELRL